MKEPEDDESMETNEKPDVKGKGKGKGKKSKKVEDEENVSPSTDTKDVPEPKKNGLIDDSDDE